MTDNIVCGNGEGLLSAQLGDAICHLEQTVVGGTKLSVHRCPKIVGTYESVH